MVGAHGVDLLDLVGEGGHFVDEELQEVVWRAFAGEQLELLVDRAAPGEDDGERDLVWFEWKDERRGWGARTMMAPMGSSPVAA